MRFIFFSTYPHGSRFACSHAVDLFIMFDIKLDKIAAFDCQLRYFLPSGAFVYNVCFFSSNFCYCV